MTRRLCKNVVMKNENVTRTTARTVGRPAVRWRGASLFPSTLVGWTASLMTIAMAITWVVRLVPAGTPAANRDMEVAAAAALHGLLKNSGCPREPEAIEEAAANLFVILNPELAHREHRKNPAFIQDEAAAAQSFFNPGALHAKRMQDPGRRRNYEAAMEAFTREARKAKPVIVPTATDSKQIAELRNNPEWRRQREGPVRALMPAGQPPSR